MLHAMPRAVPRVCCVRDGAEQGQTARKTQMHVCTLCGRFLKREDWGSSAPLASDGNVNIGNHEEPMENQGSSLRQR